MKEKIFEKRFRDERAKVNLLTSQIADLEKTIANLRTQIGGLQTQIDRIKPGAKSEPNVIKLNDGEEKNEALSGNNVHPDRVLDTLQNESESIPSS